MPQGGREWSYRPAPAIRVPIKPVDLYNANTLGLTCQVEKDRKGKEPSSLPAPLISRSSSYLHQVRQASREHTVLWQTQVQKDDSPASPSGREPDGPPLCLLTS